MVAAAGHRPGDPEARAARHRLRKRLALWSLPFVIVLALVATKLLTMVALGDEALRAYSSGNVTGTEEAGSAWASNLIEPHKAPFARGDARSWPATTTALEQRSRSRWPSPHRTHARPARSASTLVLSLEKLGQAAQTAGRADQAKQYFDRVQEVAAAAPPGCFEGGAQNEEGQQLRDAQQRAQDQNQQNQDQQNQQNQGQQQNQPSEDKQQQLDDKTQENLEQRQQGDEQNGAVTRPPVDKPW